MTQATFIKLLTINDIGTTVNNILLVKVPEGRRLAPQGAWEMLRSPTGLRGPGVKDR